MMRNIVCLLLVNVVLGEHHWLRGQPGSHGSLAAEITPVPAQPKAATLVQKSMGKVKGLINFMLRIKTPEDERENRENKAALVDFKEFSLMSGSETFVTFACWLCLYTLCAAYYQNYILHYAPPIEKNVEKHQSNEYQDYQEFKSGICAFDQVWRGKYAGICFWSCLCPGIRWADTISALGIHKFWSAFWFLTALYCIAFIPLATIPCFIIVVCYMTYYRQKFRQKFSFDEQGGSTYVADCFTYCFCMCCAVAQEARHARAAGIAAHPATIISGQPTLESIGEPAQA